ncbi:MAG TPA: cytochrome c-type biogenesis protein CcmH [Vicinamibacteria bacterium]|jgi:cytochrome c-type biogenesis protein CcmH
MIALAALFATAAVTLEERAERLEAKLVAPCCFQQILTMHDSDPARTMKEEIRRDLAAGRSEEEILAGYVERYGIQILSEPPPVGFHRFLTAAPPILFAASLALLFAILRRWRRRRGLAVRAESISPEMRRRIERELRSQ